MLVAADGKEYIDGLADLWKRRARPWPPRVCWGRAPSSSRRWGSRRV